MWMHSLKWVIVIASRVVAGILILMKLFGCQTLPQTVVLERADNLDAMPKWASISEPVKFGEGVRLFLGFVEVDGDSHKSAALNMADEKAMSEPMRSLVEAFLDQNQVGEELQADGSLGRRIISATSGYRPPMPSLHIVKRYYEVVSVDNGAGGRRLRLRVYSLAEVSKPDYDRAKASYLKRLAGDSDMKKLMDEVGREQVKNLSPKDLQSKTSEQSTYGEQEDAAAQPLTTKPVAEVSKSFPEHLDEEI